MKPLAVGRPRDGAEIGEIAQYAREEMSALWQLYRGGVREMYSPGRPGAVLVLEAAPAREARVALAGLPLTAAGLIVFEVIELHPFGAFEVLFAGGQRPVSPAGRKDREAE